MLRAKDGSLHRDWRLLTQGSAVGLVVTVAFLATAIRGLAEPPETESDGSIRVARATDTKQRPPVTAANPVAEAKFFQRPPFDPAKLALSEKGGFLIRVGEILQQPRFARAAREQNEWLVKLWKDTFPGVEAPPVSLSDIDYLACDFMLSARYVPSKKVEKDPHPHQILFGSQCGFIRWQKPVDEIFAWLTRTPGAEVKQHGEITYVALPIAFMGPAITCLCCFDDHTLLWAGGEGVMQKRLDQLAVAHDPPTWHYAWKEVEGGLLMAVAAIAEYKDPPQEDVDEAEQLTQDFFAKTGIKALGADWQPNEGGDVTFHLQFRFDNEEDARTIETGIHRALEMLIQESRDDVSKA